MKNNPKIHISDATEMVSEEPNEDRIREALRFLERRREPKTRKNGVQVSGRPSIIGRIQKRRKSGPESVADYVIMRRHEILNKLRVVSGTLTVTEWAIIERKLREINDRSEKRKSDAIDTSIKRRSDHEKAEALVSSEISNILNGEHPVLDVAKSRFTMAELSRRGLKGAQYREVAMIRKESLRLKDAAEYLGIPKGRLDRWIKEGLVKPSFTRKCHITGVGTVDARHFIKEELDELNLEAIDFRSKRLKGEPLKAVSSHADCRHG